MKNNIYLVFGSAILCALLILCTVTFKSLLALFFAATFGAYGVYFALTKRHIPDDVKLAYYIGMTFGILFFSFGFWIGKIFR